MTPALHDGRAVPRVARAFADIIDAKSPYTYRHSTRVADIARGVAEIAGIDAAGQDRLFRAALLHDIGKLGVSSRILDKPAALTPDERRAVELHPLYTWEILSHVSAFAEPLAPDDEDPSPTSLPLLWAARSG